MIRLARRALNLFVDSVWLAFGALGCAAAAAAAIRAGAPPRTVACAMLAGLAAVLAASIAGALRSRPRAGR